MVAETSIPVSADALAHSQQPLVPETVLGGGGDNGGIMGTFINLLVAEKLGVKVPQIVPPPTAPVAPAKANVMT